jgi:hypothetical protein
MATSSPFAFRDRVRCFNLLRLLKPHIEYANIKRLGSRPDYILPDMVCLFLMRCLRKSRPDIEDAWKQINESIWDDGESQLRPMADSNDRADFQQYGIPLGLCKFQTIAKQSPVLTP